MKAMNANSGNNNQQIKFLFARLREQLEQQRLSREKSMVESGTESKEGEDSHCPIKNKDYSSKSSNSNSRGSTVTAASDVPKAPALGKQKARQEGLSRNFLYFEQPRIATEEEIQAIVDFADTCFLSVKRKSTGEVGDDKE